MNKDLCQNEDCKNYGRYARFCGHYKITPTEQKPIATFSKERQKINRKEYGPAAKKFVQENPICQIGLPGCTKKAVCVHHTKGRTTIQDLLNIEFWKSACANCNGGVEIKDKEARETGNKKSKHLPNYKRIKV